MIAITEADRKAAEELRAVLADVSGFWHLPGDNGPLCVALAQHRERTELQLLRRMSGTELRATYSDRTRGSGEGAAFDKSVSRSRSQAMSR